ncbi:MAG: hypothetical protein ACREMJ_01610 [Gemmatimonadales bacterium]
MDLRTPDSRLSVYVVPPGEDPSQVAVALAGSNKQRFDESGYLLFDSDLLNDLEIRIAALEAGTTPDEVVNPWHRDLVELSTAKLAELARVLWENREGLLDSVPKQVVEERLVTGVRDGRLTDRGMHEDMQKEIQRRLAQ